MGFERQPLTAELVQVGARALVVYGHAAARSMARLDRVIGELWAAPEEVLHLHIRQPHLVVGLGVSGEGQWSVGRVRVRVSGNPNQWEP